MATQTGEQRAHAHQDAPSTRRGHAATGPTLASAHARMVSQPAAARKGREAKSFGMTRTDGPLAPQLRTSCFAATLASLADQLTDSVDAQAWLGLNHPRKAPSRPPKTCPSPVDVAKLRSIWPQ